MPHWNWFVSLVPHENTIWPLGLEANKLWMKRFGGICHADRHSAVCLSCKGQRSEICVLLVICTFVVDHRTRRAYVGEHMCKMSAWGLALIVTMSKAFLGCRDCQGRLRRVHNASCKALWLNLGATGLQSDVSSLINSLYRFWHHLKPQYHLQSNR